MALDYGSIKELDDNPSPWGGENWTSLKFDCNSNPNSHVITVTGKGSVGTDRELHVKACAYGGALPWIGAWNCGDVTTVRVEPEE
ncbi:hypothetical protein ADK64_21025 [Streptomyces sp. MMG1121]|nr:hypothetical protein ADK64_21025 [Streptomyces sp. MMG1121]